MKSEPLKHAVTGFRKAEADFSNSLTEFFVFLMK